MLGQGLIDQVASHALRGEALDEEPRRHPPPQTGSDATASEGCVVEKAKLRAAVQDLVDPEQSFGPVHLRMFSTRLVDPADQQPPKVCTRRAIPGEMVGRLPLEALECGSLGRTSHW